jgi:hypothetical protein
MLMLADKVRTKKAVDRALTAAVDGLASRRSRRRAPVVPSAAAQRALTQVSGASA